MLKILFIVFIFFYASMPVQATTWYDRLPASGEHTPKAGADVGQPNYSGNINFNESTQQDTGAGLANNGVAEKNEKTTTLVNKGATNTSGRLVAWLLVIISLAIIIVLFWSIRSSRKL